MISAAIAALLLSAASPAAPASTPITPTLHVSIGTGYCDRAFVPGTNTRGANPCYLVFGVLAALRYGVLEAGRKARPVQTGLAPDYVLAVIVGGALVCETRHSPRSRSGQCRCCSAAHRRGDKCDRAIGKSDRC